MAGAVRLQVVHRNRLFRECLVSVLSGESRYHVEEVDHSRPDHQDYIREQCPDVVLVDSGLPEHPVPLIEHVRKHVDAARIVLLVHAEGQDDLAECIAAGAHGCVLEQSSLGELQEAIERVLEGETFCSPKLVDTMFRRLAETSRQVHWQERVRSVDLTPRELEIVGLIADRLSNKQIARRLCVSLYTVKNHVHNILEKLQVEDRFGAVEYARRHRLLKNPRRPGAVAQPD